MRRRRVFAKVSRAEFADLYANSAAPGWGQDPGMGVQVAAVTQRFTQGGLRATDNPLDVAINGSGFFRLVSLNNDFVVNMQNHTVKTAKSLTKKVMGGRLCDVLTSQPSPEPTPRPLFSIRRRLPRRL